jgi:hypothetical protein
MPVSSFALPLCLDSSFFGFELAPLVSAVPQEQQISSLSAQAVFKVMGWDSPTKCCLVSCMQWSLNENWPGMLGARLTHSLLRRTP